MGEKSAVPLFCLWHDAVLTMGETTKDTRGPGSMRSGPIRPARRQHPHTVAATTIPLCSFIKDGLPAAPTTTADGERHKHNNCQTGRASLAATDTILTVAI